MQLKGERIFVQMQQRSDDGANSLHGRVDADPVLKEASKDKALYLETVCKKWLDVRTFGQVFAFKNKNNKEAGVSVSVTGPVQINIAKSILPIEITEMQIIKSVNSEDTEGDKKSSDTMGSRAYVENALYVIKGSISPYLAEKTGFSAEDAEIVKDCLKNLYLGDESAARPAGSVNVRKLFWWTHNCKSGNASSAKVFDSVNIVPIIDSPKKFADYNISVSDIDGVLREEFDL